MNYFFKVFCALFFYLLCFCKSPSKQTFQSNTNTNKKTPKIQKTKPIPPPQKAEADIPTPSQQEKFIDTCTAKQLEEPFKALKKLTNKKDCQGLYDTLSTLTTIDLSGSNCCSDKDAFESLSYLNPEVLILKGASISEQVLENTALLKGIEMDLSYNNVSQKTQNKLAEIGITLTINPDIKTKPEDAVKIALMKSFLLRPEGKVTEIIGQEYIIQAQENTFPRQWSFGEDLAIIKDPTKHFTLKFKIKSSNPAFLNENWRSVTVKNAKFSQTGGATFDQMSIELQQNDVTRAERTVQKLDKLYTYAKIISDKENTEQILQQAKERQKTYDNYKNILMEGSSIVTEIDNNMSDEKLAQFYAAWILRQLEEIFTASGRFK